MHPAFSVIFFTTLSGAGYGLWIWLGLRLALGARPVEWQGIGWAVVLLLGLVLTSVGLLSSLAHLGKPARAWRAFSQWRTSWLSREGVAAVVTILPALALFWLLWSSGPRIAEPALRTLGVVLVLCSLATVVCTAMIYASLKPIPAWRHRLVVPGYLLFALLTGGLLYATTVALAVAATLVSNMLAPLLLALAIGLLLLKRRYWRDVDAPLPYSRGDAIGLPQREATVFERPHTQASYITREMVHVLARKHSWRLRAIAGLLFAVLPALLMLPPWLLVHADVAPWYAVAASCALVGAAVERWLFFAEARHLVSLYY